MKICRTKSELREIRAQLGADGATVGLVPTMGYLHDGHLSLVHAAQAQCDRVIVTIFVNPTQFGPNEDLATYPRDPDRDLAMLRDAGVDAVFMPDPSEMYGPSAETIVEPKRLSSILIGRLRPGHFRGVATIVTKLFNLAQPHRAYFGQKDFQQLTVIRRFVEDLDIPVQVEGVPIVREADGLAMSSRNVRLTPEHRAAAPVLHAALGEGREAIESGANVTVARKLVRARLATAHAADIRSVDIRDSATLERVSGRPERPVVILLAVRFGDVLLIDNCLAHPSETAK